MIKKLLFIILLFIPTYLLAGEPGNEPVSNEIVNTNDQEITNNKMPVANENQSNEQNLNVETSSNEVKQPTEIKTSSKETCISIFVGYLCRAVRNMRPGLELRHLPVHCRVRSCFDVRRIHSFETLHLSRNKCLK